MSAEENSQKDNIQKFWPYDYVGWTGTMKELVETSRKIIAENIGICSVDFTKLPDERLIRFYQSKGIVSKGVKAGRNAIFDFKDLSAVVFAREMKSGGVDISHLSTIAYMSGKDVGDVGATYYKGEIDNPKVISKGLSASVVQEALPQLNRVNDTSQVFLASQCNVEVRGEKASSAMSLVDRLMGSDSTKETDVIQRAVAASPSLLVMGGSEHVNKGVVGIARGLLKEKVETVLKKESASVNIDVEEGVKVRLDERKWESLSESKRGEILDKVREIANLLNKS